MMSCVVLQGSHNVTVEYQCGIKQICTQEEILQSPPGGPQSSDAGDVFFGGNCVCNHTTANQLCVNGEDI